MGYSRMARSEGFAWVRLFPRAERQDCFPARILGQAVLLEVAWRTFGELATKRERANPREVEGKQALFVVNLPPREMAGVMSEAMLFDIGYADGITPVLAVPESRVPNGTRAG